MENKQYLVSFLMRAGIAACFLYAAVATTLSPEDWIGYIPQLLRSVFSEKSVFVILSLFSAYQLALAGWLISGKYVYRASIASSITLLLIIIANIQAFDIVFRDIPILFTAIALGYVPTEAESVNSPAQNS